MNRTDNISTTNQTCVNCHTVCGLDELYCRQCGYILPYAMNSSKGETHTQLLGSIQGQAADLQWGTGYFHHRAKLFLRPEENDLAIPVPIQGRYVIIGRAGNKSDEPHVDLSPFGALTMGVSRRHIRIDRIQDYLQITDLESANGTYLNRNRLVPGVASTLRNRAVLQLGQMVLRVQFA
jgi:hypothetical protein